MLDDIISHFSKIPPGKLGAKTFRFLDRNFVSKVRRLQEEASLVSIISALILQLVHCCTMPIGELHNQLLNV